MVVKESASLYNVNSGRSTATLSHGSEGRPEEMICLKKVKLENGIWICIDFIFWIDCSMCVLLLTGQHFKTVRNQRKETLK